MRRIGHYIAGHAVEPAGPGAGAVFDPATGVQIAEVDMAGADLVDAAVQAARNASYGWASTPVSKRARVMFAFRSILADRMDEVAALITLENGKTAADARGEVARALESVEFACGAPELLKGEFSRNVSAGIDVHTMREPVGVIAGITPFNFPVMVPLWMAANAIACGNSFVLKPSEKDPSAPLRLAELLTEAGLPAGVFNVVNGDQVAAGRLLGHPAVDAVSFVGSTPVAAAVYEKAAAAGKRVQALGGAKNHMVVFPDADLERAAEAAIAAGYGAAGERCMAISVVVAVGDVAEPLVNAIAAKAREVKVGKGQDPGVEMGPLISRPHRDRVAAYLDAASEAGAVLVVDGRETGVTAEAGYFLGPSLLDHVTPDMTCYQNEIFGPVLGMVRADSYEDALKLVNSNCFGNGVAIFTKDGLTAQRFASECNIGMVGINVPVPVPVAYHSFGGWKSSLFGDLHMYGPEGVRFCTRQKVVTTAWE